MKNLFYPAPPCFLFRILRKPCCAVSTNEIGKRMCASDEYGGPGRDVSWSCAFGYISSET